MNPVRRLFRILQRGSRVARGRWLLVSGIAPASRKFGYERGTPIHRHYISQFMEQYRGRIRGHCAEFNDHGYTKSYGKPAKADVIDLNASNPRATVIGDLTKPNSIPSGVFDCIICTHVLHLVYEADAFTRDMHRILAPGGVLLIAVPGTSMIDPDWTEYRRWTGLGIRTLLEQFFPTGSITVHTYGNSLAAAAEMRGIAAEELALRELNAQDDLFQVEVCAIAEKPHA